MVPPILAARLLNTIQEPKRRRKKERMWGPLDLGFILKRRGGRGDGREGERGL
jgi:hypothetical protein